MFLNISRLVSVVVFLLTMVPIANSSEVLSVCDVLADLPRYSQQIIEVKARLETTQDLWLTADNCKSKLRVNNTEFQNILAVAWPNDSSLRAAGLKVPFPEDDVSSRLVGEILRIWDRKMQSLIVTVSGLLVTRTPPLAFSHPKRPDLIVGFGHLGTAPAQIVVKQIRRIEIVDLRQKELQ